MRKIKKYSDFLVEKELMRISKKIGLLKESKEDSDNAKENIIKTTTKLFNDINAENIEQELGIDITETKPDISWEITYHKPLEETPKEISETLPEETGILKEVLPKKNDSPEIKTAKKGIIQEISDKLVGKSKKLLLFACLSLLGVAGFNEIFTDEKANIKTAGISMVEDEDSDGKKISVQSPTTIQFFTPGNIGVGGSIGEVDKNKINKQESGVEIEDFTFDSLPQKLQDEAKKIKGYENLRYIEIEGDVNTNSLIKITGGRKYLNGKPYDPQKTVFLSGSFPYGISYDATSGEYLEGTKQKTIVGEYLVELENLTDTIITYNDKNFKKHSDKKTGYKLLILAMAYFEGFEKGTTAYITRNPGNIGNTDTKKTVTYKSLKAGIAAQLDYIENAISGGDEFKEGEYVVRKPYWSPDPNLKRWIPGSIFKYDGTLEQFIKIYATGPRDSNNYLNVILTFFKTYMPEAKITQESKIKDIIEKGDKGTLLNLLQNNHPNIKELVAVRMKEHKKSFSEIETYTGLSKKDLEKIGINDVSSQISAYQRKLKKK